MKCDLHSDRTSATTFLANALRLLLSCAAYVLHHALRTHTLAHTALGHCATLHGDPHAVQSGNPRQTVQGPDSPPPADVLPGQSTLAPCHHPTFRRPRPGVEHVLIRRLRLWPRATALRPSGPRTRARDGSPGRQHRPLPSTCPTGPWCARFQGRTLAGLQRCASRGLKSPRMSGLHETGLREVFPTGRGE